MKYLLPILLLFLIAKSYSQDTIYLHSLEDTIAVAKKNAQYFKVINRNTDTFEVCTYYMNGNKISKIHYTSLKPEIKDGDYETYFYNGATNIKGVFKNGKMNGVWLVYNKEKKIIEEKSTFKDNLRNGKSYTFYENGKLSRLDIYRNDTLLKSSCYDSTSKEINCEILFSPNENKPDSLGIYTNTDSMPDFPSGGTSALKKYLSKNIRYPKAATKNGLEGKVVVKFYIDSDGTVRQPQVLKDGVGGGCAEEAVRVINNMPKWIPGSISGKPVKVYYTLPIFFILK